jgi:hypothetical protein
LAKLRQTLGQYLRIKSRERAQLPVFKKLLDAKEKENSLLRELKRESEIRPADRELALQHELCKRSLADRDTTIAQLRDLITQLHNPQI